MITEILLGTLRKKVQVLPLCPIFALIDLILIIKDNIE